jgi:hypothetical protein
MAEQGATKEEVLSPRELNSHADSYHDQNVIVKGYVTLYPNGHSLYQSRELSLEFVRRLRSGDPAFDPTEYQEYCLTIANPGFMLDHQHEWNGKTIIAKGRFIKNYLAGYIDMGACPLPTAIVIDEADLKRRYSEMFRKKREH